MGISSPKKCVPSDGVSLVVESANELIAVIKKLRPVMVEYGLKVIKTEMTEVGAGTGHHVPRSSGC